MSVVSRRHDLIAIYMIGPREMHVPSAGLVELYDAEPGRSAVIDTGSDRIRREYDRANEARRHRLRESLLATNVDHIEIQTDQDYVRELVRFFQTRERRQTSETAR